MFETNSAYCAKVGADGTQSGWLSDDGAAVASMMNPHAVDWRTTDFEPGDIVVLGNMPCPHDTMLHHVCCFSCLIVAAAGVTMLLCTSMHATRHVRPG